MKDLIRCNQCPEWLESTEYCNLLNEARHGRRELCKRKRLDEIKRISKELGLDVFSVVKTQLSKEMVPRLALITVFPKAKTKITRRKKSGGTKRGKTGKV